MVFCVKKFIVLLLFVFIDPGKIMNIFYNLLRLISVGKLKGNFEILSKNDKGFFAFIKGYILLLDSANNL